MKHLLFLLILLPLAALSQVGPVPASLGLPAYYTKYLDASGIPIIASHRAPDSALVVARDIVVAMTSYLRPEIADAMRRHGARVAVMGRYEGTTDLPEHAYLAADTTLNWDLRARGLGGTIEEPLTSCAEENLLAYQIDKYHAEDILIHEFAHAIHLMGILPVDTAISTRLEALRRQAVAEGLWADTYAGTNFEEYWAEGVQDWFNVNAEVPRPDGKHNHVNTREELRRYDPRLYALIAEYFPATQQQISRHKKVNRYKRRR